MLDDIVQALARGMEKQGHYVTVVNAYRDEGKSLTSFGYIAVGMSTPSLLSNKTPHGLENFLKNAGMLSGKRSYAFVCGMGMRKAGLLKALMRTMENEGMYLKKSDLLNKPAEAEAVGAMLHINRNR